MFALCKYPKGFKKKYKKTNKKQKTENIINKQTGKYIILTNPCPNQKHLYTHKSNNETIQSTQSEIVSRWTPILSNQLTHSQSTCGCTVPPPAGRGSAACTRPAGSACPRTNTAACPGSDGADSRYLYTYTYIPMTSQKKDVHSLRSGKSGLFRLKAQKLLSKRFTIP